MTPSAARGMGLAVCGMSLMLASWSRAGEAETREPAARIAETQLSLEIGPARGRATAIGKDGTSLVVETAAHVMPTNPAGSPVVVGSRGKKLEGRVVSLARNPDFQPFRLGYPDPSSIDGAIGVDSAVVVIELRLRDDRERRVFAAIRPASLAARRFPARSPRIVSVHIVDQNGREHVVRAGNHLNPKCLAWGSQSFQPQPGDSGSGVFVLIETADGTARPVLIGNVAQSDERGGIASLAHRAPWVEQLVSGPHRAR